MFCFSLGIVFDIWNQLLLHSYNPVVNFVCIVWFRSTIIVPFDSSCSPPCTLKTWKVSEKKIFDFWRKIFQINFLLLLFHHFPKTPSSKPSPESSGPQDGRRRRDLSHTPHVPCNDKTRDTLDTPPHVPCNDETWRSESRPCLYLLSTDWSVAPGSITGLFYHMYFMKQLPL